MRNTKWIVFGVAMAMIIVTGAMLHRFEKQPHLGRPGVRISQVPIYDDNNNLAATQSIVLPSTVLGIPAVPAKYSPITTQELTTLPHDTTFGRRIYEAPNDNFRVQLSVVLMGTDHTSIHQPQYCLYAQNWTITKMDRITLPMDRPFQDIPAVRITATTHLKNGQEVNCIYVYWFVSGEKVTAEEGSRLWSMWKTILEKGEMERWAYVSYFVACPPGAESATFGRLENFIRASAPQFQLVTGNGPDGSPPLAAQK